MNVVDAAIAKGLTVAIVEEALWAVPAQQGCIPSKILIHNADVVRDAEEAASIGCAHAPRKH